MDKGDFLLEMTKKVIQKLLNTRPLSFKPAWRRCLTKHHVLGLHRKS